MKEIGVKDDLKDFWLEHLDGLSHEGKSADRARAGGEAGWEGWSSVLDMPVGHPNGTVM